MLLVFMSTLGIDIATTAHNVNQFAQNVDYEVESRAQCEAGLPQLQNTGQSISYLPLIADKASEEEKGNVIVSNCSTSLQLISTRIISLNQPHITSAADHSVLLADSQLFILPIADPPQLV